MHSLLQSCQAFLRNEDGPTSVEYAVMLSLIITVCASAVTTLGSNTNRTFNSAANALKTSSS